jgi:putative membrane protein
MMGCDYLPFSSWMGGGFDGGIFSLLFWGLIILLLVFVAIKLFGSIKSNQTGSFHDKNDSLEILKTRYANGEINQDEYGKMKGILLQS